MSTSYSRVTIGTAIGGTLLAINSPTYEEGSRTMRVHLTHIGVAGTAYLGDGTAVTTATGWPLVSTAGAATFWLDPGEQMYAIGTAVGGTIAVFTSGA